MEKFDKFVTAIWVFLVCLVIGICLAGCHQELPGGLLIMAGIANLLWQMPMDFNPPRRPEPEIVEVHHHVSTTNLYQLPRYDRVTEGVQLDLRDGKLTRLTRWE